MHVAITLLQSVTYFRDKNSKKFMVWTKLLSWKIDMLKGMLVQNGLNKLITIQFAIYAIIGILGFIAWMLAFTGNVSILEGIIGEYFHGHIVRWTAQLPHWGILILLSAILSLGATYFLWCLRKEGAYLGVASFCIGFVTNILFARNILVHALIGILIGWTLLAPLTIAWKNLKRKQHEAF